MKPPKETPLLWSFSFISDIFKATLKSESASKTAQVAKKGVINNDFIAQATCQ